MKIINGTYSSVRWNDESTCYFKTRDKVYPQYLQINYSSSCWQQEFCHELGHILLATLGRFSLEKYKNNPRYKIRIEMLAHRLGKSFCKPKYWNDQISIRCLQNYMDFYSMKYNSKKLTKNGIIEFNPVKIK